MGESIITLITGDIIELEGYDAIVISTNPNLKSNVIGNIAAKLKSNFASLDARVRSICGYELEKECEERISESHELSVGEAFVSKAPNLNYKYIIHTVAPNTKEEGEDEFLLRSCYKAIFSEAQTKGISKIVIPAIATNYKKYPVDRATRIAVETARDYCDSFEKITFVINKNSDSSELLKKYYEGYINNESIDTDKRFSIKIEILEYNEEEIKRKLNLTFLSDSVISIFLKKGIMPAYRLFDLLGINIKSDKYGISSENLKPILNKYLNDVRIKFIEKKAYILIDLKNVNITELISDIKPLVKNEKVKIILENINGADEEKKNTVLNACFDMFFSGDIVQNIFSELASKGDNKAFRAIRSYGIKIGKIQYSKI